MARQSDPEPLGSVTLERASRLYRLIEKMTAGPQTRAALARKLRLGVRGFYRDLEMLRAVGIRISLTNGKYELLEGEKTARDKLPFPDPGLNLGEARVLARGRSRGHKKIKEQLKRIEG